VERVDVREVSGDAEGGELEVGKIEKRKWKLGKSKENAETLRARKCGDEKKGP
jgi:hypothetical protein